MPASHPAGSTFPQESSSPGTLGPHCPVGPLAPASPDGPCPHWLSLVPRPPLGSPLPGHPWLTPRISQPGPVGTATSFSMCYGLNCHSCSALGGTWRQTVCANVQHAGECLQTVPVTNSHEDQGQGGLCRLHPLPSWLYSFFPCHVVSTSPCFSALFSSPCSDEPLTRFTSCEGHCPSL